MVMPMPEETAQKTIENVTVLGGGLIGASWAALFLGQEYRVTVQDIACGFEARVAAELRRVWPDLVSLGLASGRPPFDQLRYDRDTARACEGADFVQECGPDRIEIKQAMVAEAEAGLRADVVIASSTSSLMASDIQAGAQNPGRILVAHPFNPPHLMPLVELVAGQKTLPAAMQVARAFYEGMNKQVITVQKEVVGHIANRLGSAVFREAVHMVAEGIASVADIDSAMAHGPGLRWALMGPFHTYHLGGGAGGFAHYIQHLGPTQAARWQELGNPALDAETVAKLIAGVEEAIKADSGSLQEKRDRGLLALLALKEEIGLAR